MQSKCSRNELHIFSISKAWNEQHKQCKKRKTSPKPLAPMDGRGNKKIFTNVVKKWARTPLSRAKNKWAEWLRRREREGDKGAKEFCPSWRHQPVQKAPAPLARLAVGPGTKATYCPGPKGCRDKWPGTNACSVVVVTISLSFPSKKTISLS